MSEWVFEAGTRLDDCFQEQLLELASVEEMKKAVMVKLHAIRRDPRAAEPWTVDGEVVYLAKTGRFTTGSVTIPPLIIAYLLEPAHRRIHLLLVCREADVILRTPRDLPMPLSSDHGVVLRERHDRAAPEPVDRALRRAIARVSRTRRH